MREVSVLSYVTFSEELEADVLRRLCTIINFLFEISLVVCRAFACFSLICV